MGAVDMAEFDTENGHNYNTSKMDVILGKLADSDTERESKLRAALANTDYTSAAIARVVTNWGFPVSEDAVRKWRLRRG